MDTNDHEMNATPNGVLINKSPVEIANTNNWDFISGIFRVYLC